MPTATMLTDEPSHFLPGRSSEIAGAFVAAIVTLVKGRIEENA